MQRECYKLNSKVKSTDGIRNMRDSHWCWWYVLTKEIPDLPESVNHFMYQNISNIFIFKQVAGCLWELQSCRTLIDFNLSNNYSGYKTKFIFINIFLVCVCSTLFFNITSHREKASYLYKRDEWYPICFLENRYVVFIASPTIII